MWNCFRFTVLASRGTFRGLDLAFPLCDSSYQPAKESKGAFGQTPNLSTPVILSGPEELSALSIHGPHMSQAWARTLFTAGPTRAPNLTREISMRPQVFDFNIKSGIRFHSSQKVWVYPFFPEYNYLVNGHRPLLEKNWKESSMPPPAVVWHWSTLMGTQLPLTQYGTGLKTGSVLETRLRIVTFTGLLALTLLIIYPDFFCRLHRTMPLLSAQLSCPRNIMLH